MATKVRVKVKGTSKVRPKEEDLEFEIDQPSTQLPSLLSNDELEDIRIGTSIIKPKQTRRYPCIYWHDHKCTHPNILEHERGLRKEFSKAIGESKKYTGEKPCTGIKPQCPFYEYPMPFVPEFDSFFIWNEGHLETVAHCIQSGDNLLIVGPTGCGKSSHVIQLASLLNWETTRYSCTDQLSTTKTIGQWLIIGEEMVWVDGHLTHALRHGNIYLEEEVDFMDPSLRGEMHTIMEEGGTITLTARHPKTGRTFRETIHKHGDFRWISTANTIGLGDDSFMYHGTQFMNAAARDRYGVIIEMTYPKPETEIEIVIKKTNNTMEKLGFQEKIEPSVAENMVRVATQVRNAFVNKQCNFAHTIRRNLNWARYYLLKGPEEATRLAILNFCSPSDKMITNGFVESIMGVHVELV